MQTRLADPHRSLDKDPGPALAAKIPHFSRQRFVNPTLTLDTDPDVAFAAQMKKTGLNFEFDRDLDLAGLSMAIQNSRIFYAKPGS